MKLLRDPWADLLQFLRKCLAHARLKYRLYFMTWSQGQVRQRNLKLLINPLILVIEAHIWAPNGLI